MFRRAVLAICLLAVVSLTACQARTRVDISISADGSGDVAVQVHLDKEAAASVPDLAQQLRVDDLKARGWSVEGPRQDQGDTVVGIRHSFRSSAEANQLMAELTSGKAPFAGFHLEQTRGVMSVDTSFRGSLDLTDGINSFANAAPATGAGTSGFPLGFDPSEVERDLHVDWSKAVPVEVVVHVPGSVKARSPKGENAVWQGAYGQKVDLFVRSHAINTRPLVYFMMSALFLLFAAGVALLWKKYRPQHFKGKGGIRARDLLDGPDDTSPK